MSIATTVAVVSAASGAYSAAKGADQARKSANQANDAAKAAAAGTGGGAVNIAGLQTQAQQVAKENAANSAALEAQYNPGAQQLRAGSLQQVLAGLPRTPETERLSQLIMAQAGQPLSHINAPGAQQYDSALTRQAVEAASNDLKLGGQLPQDVRNLVARNAFARSGQVSQGLQLGRDLTTRDLGLTSLDLYNKRLANAAAIGQQEAALGQGNASLRQANDALGVNVAGLNMQGEQYGRGNLFDSASFLNNVSSGGFSRALAAAQLGQNIAAPMSGLDPGAVVNLAVGNSNNAATAAQQAAALGVQTGNQKAALGGQLLGTGLGFIQNYLNQPKAAAPVYTAPNYVQPYSKPAVTTGYSPGFSYQPTSPAFKSYFGT